MLAREVILIANLKNSDNCKEESLDLCAAFLRKHT